MNFDLNKHSQVLLPVKVSDILDAAKPENHNNSRAREKDSSTAKAAVIQLHSLTWCRHKNEVENCLKP